MADETTVNHILAVLADLHLVVHRYDDPQALGRNAHRHSRDLVLSLYGGQISRSRMALVPAICEAHGLNYVGPDAYGSIICQDKNISKSLAREFGIATPWHRVIRTYDQLRSISTLPTPFVVKPLLEGSSIGITQRNLIRDVKDGLALANFLLRHLDQPILIEEFVGGKEVSYCCIETNTVNHWSFSDVSIEGAENYFDSHLYEADNTDVVPIIRTIDDALLTQERDTLDAFLRALGRFGYCRVDGKHHNGHFVFLEVTPDAWIGQRGVFAKSFINKGWTYADIIQEILLSGMSPPSRPSRI